MEFKIKVIDGEYEVIDEYDGATEFTGSLADCYAYIKLIEMNIEIN